MAELNTKRSYNTFRWGTKYFLSSSIILFGFFLSASVRDGNEFIIFLLSGPITVHRVAATISLPASVVSFDLRSVAMV